jgi:hypothetical protein
MIVIHNHTRALLVSNHTMGFPTFSYPTAHSSYQRLEWPYVQQGATLCITITQIWVVLQHTLLFGFSSLWPGRMRAIVGFG